MIKKREVLNNKATKLHEKITALTTQYNEVIQQLRVADAVLAAEVGDYITFNYRTKTGDVHVIDAKVLLVQDNIRFKVLVDTGTDVVVRAIAGEYVTRVIKAADFHKTRVVSDRPVVIMSGFD